MKIKFNYESEKEELKTLFFHILDKKELTFTDKKIISNILFDIENKNLPV